MLFFVSSLFRDVMQKKRFLFSAGPQCLPDFKKRPGVTNFMAILLLVCFLALVSCGPETILLRPSLDTPSHHVDNGYKLMAYGKTDAAVREFKRSMELNPEYAPAYVGLGIVYGMQGDLEQGRTLMRKAKSLARNGEQKKEVEMGFERLDYIEAEEL
jgi:tetratricopeptide (TPR) repeat protein